MNREGPWLHAVLGSVALEVEFHTLWQQALATALTAAAEDGASALGSHAGTEAELAFAGAFGRLVSAFHVLGPLE